MKLNQKRVGDDSHREPKQGFQYSPKFRVHAAEDNAQSPGFSLTQGCQRGRQASLTNLRVSFRASVTLRLGGLAPKPFPGQAQFLRGLFHPFSDAASSSTRGRSCVKFSFMTNANAPLC